MKIKTISIKHYKAFYGERTLKIDGKNLFIYGENGSGKSSFYYAMKDFFQSSVEALDYDETENIFIPEAEKGTGHIEVIFNPDKDGNKQDKPYKITKTSKNTYTEGDTSIRDAIKLKSFLTYKHLLDIHHIKKDDEIDLFDLLVKGVLKHFKSVAITGSSELGELWSAVEESIAKPTEGRIYNITQKKSDVNKAVRTFNDAFKKLFDEKSIEYILKYAQPILDKFEQDIKLKLTYTEVRPTTDYKDYEGNHVRAKITYLGKEIPKPHFFLNEARLSAIAISIYLGMIKRHIQRLPCKILFLDDIFIGLDIGNRLPMLKILTEEFSDYQFFITTYDRHWYEVAKINLKGWRFVEFYKSNNGVVINQKQQTDLQRAKAYFDAFDFAASAKYLRKECERILKEKLIATYQVGEMRDFIKPPNLTQLIDRLKVYYEDLGLQAPDELVDALQTYRSVLLNPMAHSDLQSPIYRMDIEKTFKAIEQLKSIKLPVRKVLIDKGSLFTLSLSDIDYTASLELAKNVYEVENEGVKSISPIEVYFKKWTRAGVDFAKPTGTSAYTNNDLLERIKESPFTLEKAIHGLNVTYKNQGLAEIDVAHLKTNIVRAGEKLSDILSGVFS